MRLRPPEVDRPAVSVCLLEVSEPLAPVGSLVLVCRLVRWGSSVSEPSSVCSAPVGRWGPAACLVVWEVCRRRRVGVQVRLRPPAVDRRAASADRRVASELVVAAPSMVIRPGRRSTRRRVWGFGVVVG